MRLIRAYGCWPGRRDHQCCVVFHPGRMKHLFEDDILPRVARELEWCHHRHRRRGLAMGIAITESSVGSILFPMMLRSTLASIGWKWAMITLAFTVAGIIVPGVLCLISFKRLARSLQHHEPHRQGKAIINFAAFRSYAFTFVIGSSFIFVFAIFGIAGFLTTIAVDTGFSPEDRYTLPSILGVGQYSSRYLRGPCRAF